MNNAGKSFGVVLGVALVTASAAIANDITIQQVPANAAPVSNAEANITQESGADSDYQKSVLSNPAINDRARVEAIMNSGDNSGGGNTAVIVQNGKSNKSSIVQKGHNNYASQSQNGDSNDLRVEQNGKNNVSHEHQVGNHNHKVKIQNGNETEETTIEQVAPVKNK